MSEKTTAELKAERPKVERYGVTIQVIAQGPYDSETSLQICCFPDHTYNKVMTEGGGTHVLNQHFMGALSDLREDDCLRGHFLETLQIIPMKRQIKAKRLLLIGLGNPERIDDAALQRVGRLAVNEAHKQNLEEFMFAPNIKDAGLTHLPTGRVAKNITLGMLSALEYSKKMQGEGLLYPTKLRDITLLSGPKFLDETWANVSAALGATN